MNPKQQDRHDRQVNKDKSSGDHGQMKQGGDQQGQMGGARSGQSTHASEQAKDGAKSVKTDGISQASQR